MAITTKKWLRYLLAKGARVVSSDRSEAQMGAATSNEGKVITDAPLFRPEVLAARQAQWMGGIRIGRPLGFSIVTGASLLMAGALVAFACWGEVTRKVTVHGVLLPSGGLINVAAPQAGTIAEVHVREGEEVAAGQSLIRLKSERVTAAGDAALLIAQALTARRTSLEAERRLTEQNLRQRLEALQQRQQSLQAEERQALAELETHRLRLQLSQRTLERHQQLAKDGFVAAAQVQQTREEQLDLQLRERTAERNLQALQRDLQAVRGDRQSLGTQTQTTLAQLDRGLASLDQESTEAGSRSSLTVTAPQHSRVSVLPLEAGQAVQSGQTLVSLVPAAQGGGQPAEDPSHLQAQLFAPSRTAGFIQPGQSVWLRYAAFPYQKFGMAEGKVIALSRSPIASQDLPNGQAQALLAAAQANEPMYRITVRLARQTVDTYGKQTYLAAGMSVDADVRQDRRKVWEWLLEPVLAVTGSQKPPSQEATSSVDLQ
ncbi:biotin/lipoyl-binding protein [Roseateles sp. DC23W]|uniref:Biotin/lipoyl-binding protein n=1 Tax=Pelomonas dachongensis TaxID=3299029 RepID=A0ABW7EV15_9BURK